MHISIYYIYIYTCEIWRTFLLYKVLIGWLECLRIIVREEFQGFEFLFPPERNKETNKQTNKHEIPPGAFGTKDCMIFLLKKKTQEKRESESSWERKDVSESHWLFIDTYCNQKKKKNPLLQLMKSVVARLFRHQLSEILDTPPPGCAHLTHLPTTPTHLPSHGPWITCTENLRFYYVQQPCLDYVLFLGFFEVISFSLSDISSGP